MFLDIYISADAALICGAPRVGRFRVPISSALRDKIRDRGYVEIAASYIRENPDGVPTHYEALRVHGLTDDALLEGVAAVHATNREMLAAADEIIERQSTAALPSRPQGHVLTRATMERVKLAERVQSARATYAKLASAVDDLLREFYCKDLSHLDRNVAVAAFGAKADAVVEEAQAFLDARQRRREAEEAQRKREAWERYEADKREAEEKAKVRRAQRRAFAVLLDNALGEHTALVSRFDDDLLPESDLWCAIRLWLSRLLTRDEQGEDLHHEASCTHYGHDVRWKLSDDAKLGRPEYGRFRDYKKRCDELIPQLAAVGLELTYKVQRGSWTCRDCDESGAPKLLSITVGTPSEDWTLDMAL